MADTPRGEAFHARHRIRLRRGRAWSLCGQARQRHRWDAWSSWAGPNGSSLIDELARLDQIDRRCGATAQPEDDYWLAMQPTWWKFIQRRSTVPANAERVPGMYLPSPYIAGLRKSERLAGSQDGTVVNYETVPRYLDYTQFTDLVAGGWIGATGAGTQIVHDVIRQARRRRTRRDLRAFAGNASNACKAGVGAVQYPTSASGPVSRGASRSVNR